MSVPRDAFPLRALTEIREAEGHAVELGEERAQCPGGVP